jgi:hypothetical protein
LGVHGSIHISFFLTVHVYFPLVWVYHSLGRVTSLFFARLHRSLQYFISSQFFSHFFRQLIGR